MALCDRDGHRLSVTRMTIAGSPAPRLDQYLAVEWNDFSRSRIQELIKGGHITLNGEQTKPGVRMKAGDVVTMTEPPPRIFEACAEEIPLDVLFEDDDLIVINKSPGMVVHPAAGNWDGTLVSALLHHCPALSRVGGEQRPGIVHRLDKETSGCIVAAKTDAAHRNLAHQFAGRAVTKIYLALAVGHFKQRAGLIEAPIGRHRVHRQQMSVVESGRGRAATTSWRVLREIGDATLVECTLHTGRTHQIRVHLKHLGHPILGDAVYGRRLGFPRQMLHAWKLGFAHPISGASLVFTSPIPSDFVDANVPPDLA